MKTRKVDLSALRAAAACIVLAACVLMSASAALAERLGAWSGRVVHVSADNVKVYSRPRHEVLGFFVGPGFHRIFSADGRTRYEKARIKPGMFVRVYYRQRALGIRHVDRILLLNP